MKFRETSTLLGLIFPFVESDGLLRRSLKKQEK